MHLQSSREPSPNLQLKSKHMPSEIQSEPFEAIKSPTNLVYGQQKLVRQSQIISNQH